VQRGGTISLPKHQGCSEGEPSLAGSVGLWLSGPPIHASRVCSQLTKSFSGPPKQPRYRPEMVHHPFLGRWWVHLEGLSCEHSRRYCSRTRCAAEACWRRTRAARQPRSLGGCSKSHTLDERRASYHIPSLCRAVASHLCGNDGDFRRIPNCRGSNVGYFRQHLRPDRPPRGDALGSRCLAGWRAAFRRRARRPVDFCGPYLDGNRSRSLSRSFHCGGSGILRRSGRQAGFATNDNVSSRWLRSQLARRRRPDAVRSLADPALLLGSCRSAAGAVYDGMVSSTSYDRRRECRVATEDAFDSKGRSSSLCDGLDRHDDGLYVRRAGFVAGRAGRTRSDRIVQRPPERRRISAVFRLSWAW
jgi:hypothetical protein